MTTPKIAFKVLQIFLPLLILWKLGFSWQELSLVIFLAFVLAFVLKVILYPSDEAESQPSDAKWKWSQVAMWIGVLAIIIFQMWYDLS